MKTSLKIILLRFILTFTSMNLITSCSKSCPKEFSLSEDSPSIFETIEIGINQNDVVCQFGDPHRVTYVQDIAVWEYEACEKSANISSYIPVWRWFFGTVNSNRKYLRIELNKGIVSSFTPDSEVTNEHWLREGWKSLNEKSCGE